MVDLITKKEMIDRALKYSTITEVKDIKHDKHGFTRWKSFKVMGREFRIEWWHNQSYLHCSGGVIVPFVTVIRSHTWPHRTKMNLQFYDSEKEVCCILPIEYYPEPSDTLYEGERLP